MRMEAADPILKIKTAPVFEPLLKPARYEGAWGRAHEMLASTMPDDTRLSRVNYFGVWLARGPSLNFLGGVSV